jgi:branched-chain amino acid transport system permease protein
LKAVGKNENMKRLVNGLLILIAIGAPFFITGNYPRHIMVMCGIWVISSMGLNLILGYVGQLNLAHGTFFGIGAYATALLIQGLGLSFWLALPLGCLITAILGFLTGLPTLRTRGHYFPIATMCLGISLYYVIARWDGLTGGARGLFGLPRPTPIPLPFIGKVSFDTTLPCYYLVLFFVFLTMLAISRFVRSLVGKRLVAIRGNENLAQSVGINTMWDKVVFLSISTLIAGLAGGLYAAYMGSLMAEQASFLGSFEMLLNVMIGGVGTMAGPFIGGILLPNLTEALHFLGGLRLVVYGVLLILIMGFLPQGIAGGLRSVALHYSQRRDAK